MKKIGAKSAIVGKFDPLYLETKSFPGTARSPENFFRRQKIHEKLPADDIRKKKTGKNSFFGKKINSKKIPQKDTMRGDRTRDQSIKSRTLYQTELARPQKYNVPGWRNR